MKLPSVSVAYSFPNLLPIVFRHWNNLETWNSHDGRLVYWRKVNIEPFWWFKSCCVLQHIGTYISRGRKFKCYIAHHRHIAYGNIINCKQILLYSQDLYKEKCFCYKIVLNAIHARTYINKMFCVPFTSGWIRMISKAYVCRSQYHTLHIYVSQTFIVKQSCK
jgi:hypothetical protein